MMLGILIAAAAVLAAISFGGHKKAAPAIEPKLAPSSYTDRRMAVWNIFAPTGGTPPSSWWLATSINYPAKMGPSGLYSTDSPHLEAATRDDLLRKIEEFALAHTTS